MDIIKIFSFLVHPGKSNENPDPVKGTEVPLQGNLFDMLSEVFHRANQECTTPIRFLMSPNGEQQNPVRDHIISILKKPEHSTIQNLAERLRDFTTGRSGLGLLFVIIGEEGKNKKIVISRFPADQGILAEAKGNNLEIEFVEQIFMKTARNYKSAFYQGPSFDSDFWDGHLVDKQLNLQHNEVANYWIRDFLYSDFRTTPRAGSRRIANALKDASKKAIDIYLKEEIILSIRLLENLAGKSISINSVLKDFPLSSDAVELIKKQIGDPQLLDSEFRFDLDEFKNIAAYRSIEFEQGQIVMAPSDTFDKCINTETIDKEHNIYRLSTEGVVVDEKLKSKK